MSERKEKFTPGPWVTRRAVAPDNVGGYDVAILDANRKIIAEAYEVVGFDVHRPVVANAYLIAAAPELYAVCDEIREHFGHFSEWDLPIGFEERLDAALAKARGEA